MLIYGKNSVLGALSAQHPIEKIIFESGTDKDDRIRMIKDEASRQKVAMEYKVGSWFQKSLGDVPHQGIAAQCNKVSLLDMNALMSAMPSAPAQRSIVLVDQVMDPHNLGAIIACGGCFWSRGTHYYQGPHESVFACSSVFICGDDIQPTDCRGREPRLRNGAAQERRVLAVWPGRSRRS